MTASLCLLSVCTAPGIWVLWNASSIRRERILFLWHFSATAAASMGTMRCDGQEACWHSTDPHSEGIMLQPHLASQNTLSSCEYIAQLTSHWKIRSSKSNSGFPRENSAAPLRASHRYACGQQTSSCTHLLGKISHAHRAPAWQIPLTVKHNKRNRLAMFS